MRFRKYVETLALILIYVPIIPNRVISILNVKIQPMRLRKYAQTIALILIYVPIMPLQI